MSIAWHGLMIAAGIFAGGWLAGRYARERGLSGEVLWNLILVVSIGGIIGTRVFYLLLNEPGSLLRPDEWLGSQGFAFYGAVIFAPLAAAAYLHRQRLSLRYLDAVAVGFPLGMAVGRIGDVINGEHHGPATSAPWGFRYLHPEAEVPDSLHAYHQGAFYEMVVAVVMLAVLWPLRGRFRRPTTLFWTVIAMYGFGRFLIFFYRSDTAGFALGINAAQATSLALVAVAGLGLWFARRRDPVVDANLRAE